MRGLIKTALTYPELWKGCVGAWCPSVDRSRSTQLTDWSSCLNHGTLTNMNPDTGGRVNWVASSGAGGGLALDFDGTNDYVSIDSRVRRVFPSTAGTISIWFSATFGRTNGLFGHLDGGERYAIWIDSSNQVYFDTLTSTVGTDRLVVSGLSWTDGTFYHLACSSGNGTGMRMYRNGILVGSISGNPVISNPPVTINIGMVRASSFQHLGKIDDVRLYNRPLELSQIQLLARRRGIAYETRRQSRVRSPGVTTNRRRIICGGNC